MMCWFKTRRHWTCVVFIVFAIAAGDFSRSHGEGPTPDDLAREGKYIEVIQSLDQTWRAKGRLSSQELKLYVDVYYLYGEELLKKGDVKNARACFVRVVSLDRRHANSHYQLGIIEKRARNYQQALPYLRTAISLGSRHSPEANKAILEIARESLAAAEKAIAEGVVQTARNYLTFVISNYAGEEKNKAQELITYKLTPLERAAAEYARATQLLGRGREQQAVKIFRSIVQTYPDTFYGPKADQRLQQLGVEIIVDQTATGLVLPPLKRRETAHFEVFYEKEIYFNRIVPRAEKVLPQIFASFGYAKPNWKRKCKMYIFNSLSDWRKFLEANNLNEWFNAFAADMEIYLYVKRDTSYMVEHTLPHELTHVVHRSIVGSFACTPLWFVDGLAVNHEEGKRKEARRKLRLLRRTPIFIPLNELLSMPTYPADQDKRYMFYLESAALVDILLQKFGPTKVREIALAYKRRTTPDAVLRNVFGMTMADLEKLWKKYVE